MVRILVSNASLPSSKIGSWTNRISKLILQNPEFFDFVLGPTSVSDSRFIFCKKRKRLPLIPSRIKQWALRNHIARDYCLAIEKIGKSSDKIQVVVIDDLVLLEAMSIMKQRLGKLPFELIYSFHGHSFILSSSWSGYVDKVLFLTRLGYLETLRVNDMLTPIVSIIGNGADSNLFYPLEKTEKEKRKTKLGYNLTDKVVIWMSNNRPKKGLHLFMALSARLEATYPDIHFLIIGENKDLKFPSDRWRAIGKIPNNELPGYLQIGDFYCFTSLWKEGFGLSLIEAAKCGNTIIASANGGIPEVLEGLENAFLVEMPNLLEAWEEAFEMAYSSKDDAITDRQKLSEFHDIKVWESKFMKALQSE